MSDHKFTADLHLGHDFVSRLRGFESTLEQTVIDWWKVENDGD